MSVALDIETTGLRATDLITCIAVAGEGWAMTWDMGPSYNHQQTAEQLGTILDESTSIYAYNGAKFDIPFIQRHFQFPDSRVGAWMLKLVDPLYAAQVLLGFEACPKLSAVLALNGVAAKTSSGTEAIAMARNGQWDRLRDYCANDTSVTYQLLERDELKWVHGLAFSKRHKGLFFRQR